VHSFDNPTASATPAPAEAFESMLQDNAAAVLEQWASGMSDELRAGC
jgi:hypothetical protein